MSKRAWRLLVVTLLVTAPLAGCMEGMPLVGGSDGQVTAREAVEDGNDVARAWQDDATLLAVMAVETDEPTSSWTEGNATLNLTADPNVGDGEAVAWGLRYASASANRTLSFIQWADGNVTHRSEDEREPEDEAPLGSWSVDSPEALEAARGSGKLGTVEDGDNVRYMFRLAEPEPDEDDPAWNGTAWAVVVTSSEGWAGAIVDASSGEVVRSFRFDGNGSRGTPSVGWGGGGGDEGRTTHQACHDDRVHRDAPEDTYTLPVSENATHAAVGLRAEKDLATDGFTLEVRGPEGDVVERYEAGPGSGTTHTFSWSESVTPGNHTVVMQLHDASVGVDYTLGTWAGVPGEDDDHGYGDWGGDWSGQEDQDPCRGGA